MDITAHSSIVSLIEYGVLCLQRVVNSYKTVMKAMIRLSFPARWRELCEIYHLQKAISYLSEKGKQKFIKMFASVAYIEAIFLNATAFHSITYSHVSLVKALHRLCFSYPSKLQGRSRAGLGNIYYRHKHWRCGRTRHRCLRQLLPVLPRLFQY